ncbi:hypothetical protein M2140_000041 [Clostridiales Family XIII bacterium PM5-7]
MEKCSCCKREKDNVKKFKLPVIGYGSLFMTLYEDEVIKFNLCDDCMRKVNKWVKKKMPQVKLEDFWRCDIIREYYRGSEMTMETFRYEKQLFDLFMKFMPQVYYDEHATYQKYRYRIRKILHMKLDL